MIKFTDNKEDIIRLWKEAFGDSKEDILYFTDHAVDAECLACYEKDDICSMLYLVDCCYRDEKGKYIYAACTAEKAKGNGYMTQLLRHTFNLGYRFICLIPAEDSLITYYENRGFQKHISIDEIQFEQTDPIKEYLLEGYQLTEPIALLYKGE